MRLVYSTVSLPIMSGQPLARNSPALFCLTALLVLLLGAVEAAPVSNLPVCVVGAGPAGLAAASRLESKGTSVVVFEKQSTVGGKCQEVYDTEYVDLP